MVEDYEQWYRGSEPAAGRTGPQGGRKTSEVG